jgi:energy-coupling factor transporter transmembrane protein EcfT|uniref:Uncharacterized protein n=1 Tax=Acidicaldus sp. TaxID=1872105 RepID=A0A8J4H793_9PROT
MIKSLADDIKTFRAVDLIVGVITGVVAWAYMLVGSPLINSVAQSMGPIGLFFAAFLLAILYYAWAVFLALIYVPIVQHESQTRRYALDIRGVRCRKMSLRGLRLLAIPVIFRSLRRGFSTALSMEARGFGVSPRWVFRL